MEHTASQSAEPTRRWSPIALLEKLEKSGVKRETATILVEVLEEAHEHQTATKADLKDTKTEFLQQLKNTEHRLQLEIEKVRRDLETKIAETKSDLIKWMVGMFFVQTLTIIGALAAFIKYFVPAIQ